MNEYDIAEKVIDLRMKLGLRPSHVDCLCKFEFARNVTKEAEKNPRANFTILQDILFFLADFEKACSQRLKPTKEEFFVCLKLYSFLVLKRHHFGVMPGYEDYESTRQEIITRALKRVKNFTHGGKKNICEFVYMSCYWALRDMQRENMERSIIAGKIPDTRKKKYFRPIRKLVTVRTLAANEPLDGLHKLAHEIHDKFIAQDAEAQIAIGRLIWEFANCPHVQAQVEVINNKKNGRRKGACFYIAKLLSDQITGVSRRLLEDRVRAFLKTK